VFRDLRARCGEEAVRLGRTYGTLTRGESIRPQVERPNISSPGYSEDGEIRSYSRTEQGGFSAGGPIPFIRMDLGDIQKGVRANPGLGHLDCQCVVIRIKHESLHKSTSTTLSLDASIGRSNPRGGKNDPGNRSPSRC
jgi:hypothetical protein